MEGKRNFEIPVENKIAPFLPNKITLLRRSLVQFFPFQEYRKDKWQANSSNNFIPVYRNNFERIPSVFKLYAPLAI